MRFNIFKSQWATWEDRELVTPLQGRVAFYSLRARRKIFSCKLSQRRIFSSRSSLSVLLIGQVHLRKSSLLDKNTQNYLTQAQRWAKNRCTEWPTFSPNDLLLTLCPYILGTACFQANLVCSYAQLTLLFSSQGPIIQLQWYLGTHP